MSDALEFVRRVGAEATPKSNANGIAIYDIDVSATFRGLQDPVKLVHVSERYAVEGAFDLEAVSRHIGQLQVNSRQVALFLVNGERSRPNTVVPAAWLVLDRVLVQAVTGAANPRVALGKLMRDKLRLGVLAPYSTSHTPSQAMFYGRDAELRDVAQNPGESFTLIGPRRIGKSSLARIMEAQIRKSAGPALRLAADRYAFSTAYVDCDLLPNLDQPVDDFFEQVLKAMKLEARDIAYNRKVFGRTIRATTPFEYFNALVSSKFSSVTLVIDEVDALIQHERKNGWPLLHKVQGLADRARGTTADGDRCRTNVILVGFAVLHDAMFDTDFPFYQRCRPLVIGNLGKSATTQLIVEPFRELAVKIEPEDEVVNRIYEQTGGMPSLVQAVCKEILLRLEVEGIRTITPALVDDAIRKLGPVANYMSWVDFQATALEKAIVYFAAPLKRLRAEDLAKFLASKGIHVDKNALNGPLDRLALANILRATRRYDTYEFSVEAFRRAVTAMTDRAAVLERLVSDARQEWGRRHSR
ncbi:MAG: hypothetical protein JWL61_2342 [Gemmatimonadetes bacterium]|nr:hypothetical protein [Gemmatimonadota bacterium]